MQTGLSGLATFVAFYRLLVDSCSSSVVRCSAKTGSLPCYLDMGSWQALQV